MREILNESDDGFAGLNVIPQNLKNDSRHIRMTDDIVRFIVKFRPGPAGNALKDLVGPKDMALAIRGGEEQFLPGEVARFVDEFYGFRHLLAALILGEDRGGKDIT